MDTKAQADELAKELAEMDAHDDAIRAGKESPRSTEQPAEAPKETPKEQPKEEPNEETPKGERVERKVYSIPLDKHNRQLENAKKLREEEIERIRQEAYEKAKAEMSNQRPNGEIDLDAEAERLGVDKEVLQGFLDINERSILSKIPKSEIPTDYVNELENLKKSRELQEAQEAFDDEFNSDVLPLLKDVPAADAQKIKQKLDELAFSPQYSTYKVADIYRLYKDEINPTVTRGIEGSRGGTTVSMPDFANYTSEQIRNMSVQEFAEYEKWEATRASSSKYRT